MPLETWERLWRLGARLGEKNDRVVLMNSSAIVARGTLGTSLGSELVVRYVASRAYVHDGDHQLHTHCGSLARPDFSAQC